MFELAGLELVSERVEVLVADFGSVVVVEDDVLARVVVAVLTVVVIVIVVVLMIVVAVLRMLVVTEVSVDVSPKVYVLTTV